MAEELEKALEQGNAHRVRELCRANPALLRVESSDEPQKSLRLRVWACLLLGRQLDGDEEEEDDFVPNVPCREFQVLLNDVPRTRAVLFGKNEDAKDAMQYMLHKFCIKNNIEYKQGLNEVVAPFVWLLPPKGKANRKLASELFEAFTIRFIERFYCTDSSFFLMKSFRLFHLLLTYHDPQLALYLKEQDFVPELYTPQFFLCLYAREVPLEQVVLIWDLFIVFDDPAFTFFIGMCLITQQRDKILLTDMHGIPEVISSNDNFKTAEGITTILNEAHTLYKRTPRSFIRHLRLCCVGSNQMTPTFQDISKRREESAEDGETTIRLNEFDQRMVLQTARPAMYMSAHELISVLDPLQSGSGAVCKDGQSDFVLIDLRAAEEGIETGGGLIPRAIQLEPNFLDYPEAFRAWLQHFDGTRGVPICIIDTPPVQSSGSIKLWRRLLLGEGDGANNANTLPPRPNSGRGNKDSGAAPSPRSAALLSLESQEQAIINAVAKSDEQRAALRLASVLQRETFGYVSVLEGGFPALVGQLRKQRGRVEPIVIQHDAERWDEYMAVTGRDEAGGGDLEGSMTAAKAKAGFTGDPQSPHGGGAGGGGYRHGPANGRVRRPGDLTREEKMALAVKRARELQHPTATAELDSRLALLATQRKVAMEEEALESMPVIDFR